MNLPTRTSWVVLTPPLAEQSQARRAFRNYALRLSALVEADADDSALDRTLWEARRSVPKEEQSAKLDAALSVLTDLARQRWLIRVTDTLDVEVKRPADERLNPSLDKARIRNQELVKRNEQLRDPATQKFIASVTRTRGKQLSIYNLLRDGRELAASLRKVRALAINERAVLLREVVDPYLQFIESDDRCEHTNLKLQDIWRYFRHTWSNQYVSTPGRSMAFLVRDRARCYHPVIGIGALGSPIMQIRERDTWIGWHPEEFMECVTELPSAAVGVWLIKTIDTAIKELYVADLYAEGLLAANDIQAPTPEVIDRLITFGEAHRKKHHRFVNSNEMKREFPRDDTSDHWQTRAETHLYKSKRALTLADMLRSRMVTLRHLSSEPSVDEVRRLLSSSDGKKIVKKVLRKAKADRVGIVTCP